MATISSRVLPLRESDKAGSEDVKFFPAWHRSAPKAVARAERFSGGSDGWSAWAAHLGRRRNPRAVAELFSGRSPSLAWALPVPTAPATFVDRLPTLELVAALDSLERQGRKWRASADPVDLAQHWTTDAAHRHSAVFGIECLAWCRALPALASLLPANLWWRLLAQLLSVAEDATVPAADPLAAQWSRAELPLTLAYLFPEITAARQLARAGAAALTADLGTSLRDDGLPVAGNLPILRPLLATLCRSRALARNLDKPCWKGSAEKRYTAFAMQALRLMRRDGTMALSTDTPTAADRDLFAAAFEGTGRPTCSVARAIAPGCAVPGAQAPRSPEPAVNNESAGISVLRPNWTRGCERLFVVRRGDALLTEFSVGRDVLWSGNWTCEVERDGAQLSTQPGAGWKEICWVSQPDADYLELELQLTGGVRVERQMLLARKDHFLLLADALIADEPSALTYRSLLPLARDISFDASTESREGYLVGRKARAVAFPLSLPEWRAEPSAGALETSDDGLALRTAATGVCRLYVPLLIDVDARRLFQPATWRRLTVAESLQIVPHDIAVGYRAHVRDRQWLFYRSLGERGNRTVLGQNLVSEFLAARFLRTGEIEPLIEVE